MGWSVDGSGVFRGVRCYFTLMTTLRPEAVSSTVTGGVTEVVLGGVSEQVAMITNIGVSRSQLFSSADGM